MRIVWRDELATGNEEIDNQHKELFRRFNLLQAACRQDKGLEELSNILAFLGEHVASHLEMEEQLQIAHEYPGYPKHKEEHDGLIINFRKLEEQLKTKGTTPELLIQTNMTLADWLTRHFTWTDKDLASFLRTTVPGRQG